MEAVTFFLTAISWFTFGLVAGAQITIVWYWLGNDRNFDGPFMHFHYYILWALVSAWLITYYYKM